VLSVHNRYDFYNPTKVKEITRLFEYDMYNSKSVVLHIFNHQKKQIFDDEYIQAHELE